MPVLGVVVGSVDKAVAVGALVVAVVAAWSRCVAVDVAGGETTEILTGGCTCTTGSGTATGMGTGTGAVGCGVGGVGGGGVIMSESD